MKRFFIVLMVSVFLWVSGCSDAPEANRVLNSQGYTHVQLTGYKFFGCGRYDYWRTGFVAKSPNGTNVVGVVCSGVFKGATIRFK